MKNEHTSFQSRHIGPRPSEVESMLSTIGVNSLDTLIDETIPASIRLESPLELPSPLLESEYLAHIEALANQNRPGTCFIGQGYYGCITPSVILRSVLENPGWYTPYTPYQAEIAQGRLESLLNFQTVVTSLTGMETANASLLDEGTAAAEAMAMMHRLVNRRKVTKNTLAISKGCFTHSVDVIRGRAEPLGIQLVEVDVGEAMPEGTFGAILQNPQADGRVLDLTSWITEIHEAGALVAVAADILSMAVVIPPGEMDADIVFGSAQRFGVPMMYGGPHAAFFGTRKSMVREIPGRIIGVSRDKDNRLAYRMALQTREQHIRRDKAKSNICTAQALLANVAAMYAVYHGPDGIRTIAEEIHEKTSRVKSAAEALGLQVLNDTYFDTLSIAVDPAAVRAMAEENDVHFYYLEDGIRVSVDETHDEKALELLIGVLTKACGQHGGSPTTPQTGGASSVLPANLERSSAILDHDIFSRFHCETEMMRYICHLERKDLGLDNAMIPLGSCTMKLNAASEMMPVTWSAFTNIHPFMPDTCTQGYLNIIEELIKYLAEITGFAGVSMQPNSGAQGEFAGLMAIRAWHLSRGDDHRDKMLIPDSAHGTNPASAVMAGMQVVVVGCDRHGNISLDDLKTKAELHKETLAGLMITYPSTHGVFEDEVQTICQTVHDCGGQVYMDGANLNAQVGLTHPGKIGADVCHLNLHKTFAIPHGGGGPGMGPIGVADHLVPFLPGHVERPHADTAMPAISAAPFGSAAVLLISYAYIRLLGEEGCRESTRVAILNANYIKARLDGSFDVLFSNQKGRVAHELIVDLRPFKETAGVSEEDVAKRLMDYGFHAPTVSWPVPGTIMIEPTESEGLAELDRFCDSLIQIRQEIRDIEEGTADRSTNLLTMAPHCAETLLMNEWDRPYSREDAAYPLPALRTRKHWPTISRIDNTHGDRNLVCSCPPMAAYQ